MKTRFRCPISNLLDLGKVGVWTAPGLMTLISLGTLAHPAPPTVLHPHPSLSVLAVVFVPSPDPSPSPIILSRLVQVPQAPAPHPPATQDMNQMAVINNIRAAHGLPPLAWSGCLAGVAASNATRVAVQGQLTHSDGANQDLICDLGSSVAGENLAFISGPPDDQRAIDLLMASPQHEANILGANYHYVGAAWAVGSNGNSYLAEEFA